MSRWNEPIGRMLRRIDDTAGRVKEAFPHWSDPATGEWVTTPHGDWTGGCWVGMLWGAHALTGERKYRELAAALVRTAELALQRVHRLLDERFSDLPPQLGAPGAAGSGLVAVHKRGVGAVNELRRLAAPASVGLSDTSLGQEDAQTFAFEAAAKLRRVEALVTDVLACELLCARQAWWLGDRRPSTGLAGVMATLAELVPPVDEDRPLGQDLDRLRALLEGGGL